MTEPLDARVERALTRLVTGAADAGEHFLTLPNGMTLTVPPGGDSWEVFTAHSMSALAENLCPWCASVLDDRRECHDSRHPATRWHLCAKGWGQTYLDLPPRSEPYFCSICGEEM